VAKGKPVIDIEKCKGCELCAEACPEKILEMSKSFNKMGVSYPVCKDEEKCTICMQCALMCPEVAITIWKEK
jgi:2-oxoglutarate ferredoxin oxidoreductase subunit delta